MECIHQDYTNQLVYVLSDEDGYYNKNGYKCAGSIFEVPKIY